MTFSVILLSGGQGTRIGRSKPKQYLPLGNKPIILHALEALLLFPDWQEIVVVCAPEYRFLFSSYSSEKPLRFASPGQDRQDSVRKGFEKLSLPCKAVCVHDGARPFLQSKDLLAVLQKGLQTGAAALAVPVRSTIKQASTDLQVEKTLDRSSLLKYKPLKSCIMTCSLKASYSMSRSRMTLALLNSNITQAILSWAPTLTSKLQLLKTCF